MHESSPGFSRSSEKPGLAVVCPLGTECDWQRIQPTAKGGNGDESNN